MTFATPAALFFFLVLPLAVVFYIRSIRRRTNRTASLAAQGLSTTTLSQSLRIRRHLPFALILLALGLLVVACARPMATITTLQRQATAIVAIDVSNSMAAADIKPSRFAAAKAAAKAFIRAQPTAVRVGVVAFGPSAVIVQTPTSIHTNALKAISQLSLGGGTSVTTGILTSLDAIAGKTLKINQKELANDNSGEVNIGFYSAASIVLFSDGENTANTDPTAISRIASVAGVHIQTVGVGTAAGTTVKIGGFSIATALNAPTLQSVAKVTNGAYHQISDTAGLTALAKSVNLHFKFVSSRTEISALFAAGAALLLAIGAVMSVLWFGRVM